ncbi:soluble scavenger receptor cysteine-rich domain-containing protein SSC5D-like isoform X1 [Acipenser oxyrinchus oxyrinchus]|uniref:Soluble scavenger receptor cysteine-rich domain-containing protein SSC5D-like isoform X1 n=1 Tax=Acipenser oxyrinchus oxyrinchus TaxID=40147 RepID=A0AAD8CFR0_ACIOX|nr:soluble scavenger receptor cysteine-rich domain-containing protein SSC5D-like isoform X1 [Acipenser oxyrinchus oxyrinchus]
MLISTKMTSLLIFWTLALLSVIDSSNVTRINVTLFCSGRVEVYHGGNVWTVCDDGWDMSDAQVVCRELGCGDAVSAPGNAAFGRGTGPILVYNATCTGSESSLMQCVSPVRRTDQCNHGEDAGVVCSDSSMKPNLTVNLVKSDELSLQCRWSGEMLNKDNFVLHKNKMKVDRGPNNTFYIKTETSNSGNYTCFVRKRGQTSNTSDSQQVTITAPPTLNSSESVRGADVTLQCSLSSSYQSPGSFILYRDRDAVLEQRVPGGDQSCTFNLTRKTTHGQQGEYSCRYYTYSVTGLVLTELSAPVNIPAHDLSSSTFSTIYTGFLICGLIGMITAVLVTEVTSRRRGDSSKSNGVDLSVVCS